ncbi:MAG: hypothetical protein J3Q66DRAFT_117601 [Benniella sp.]|nr:MAG: hypothetical protein J3Q66DRAFT_117601 [Benniella sp.]
MSSLLAKLSRVDKVSNGAQLLLGSFNTEEEFQTVENSSALIDMELRQVAQKRKLEEEDRMAISTKKLKYIVALPNGPRTKGEWWCPGSPNFDMPPETPRTSEIHARMASGRCSPGLISELPNALRQHLALCIEGARNREDDGYPRACQP